MDDVQMPDSGLREVLGFSSLGFLLSNIRQVTLRIGSELEGEQSEAR